MEYIKPIFLLLFVLGIVSSVSSRRAAKHYPVEDAGNQDESSLVKKTLKLQGSSLTSAFDIGEEKNKREVSSVSDVGDSPASVVFTIRNPDGGLTWQAGGVYLLKGSKVDELPDVNPGAFLDYKVEQDPTGAAGVFTYYNSDKDRTLAVMFRYVAKFKRGWYYVKLYTGNIVIGQFLFDKMESDQPWLADGKERFEDLGSGLGADVQLPVSDEPNIKIAIVMFP